MSYLPWSPVISRFVRHEDGRDPAPRLLAALRTKRSGKKQKPKKKGRKKKWRRYRAWQAAS